MSGYIGAKQGVTQVDGYNRSEADAEFVQTAGDTMTGALAVNGNLTVDTNTLFVDAASNRVGVGTTTPAVAFGVAGNSVISGASPFISLAYNQAGATPNYWQLGADGVATLFNAGTGSNGAWKFDIGGGSEAMRITSIGSVGIGTTSSTSGGQACRFVVDGGSISGGGLATASFSVTGTANAQNVVLVNGNGAVGSINTSGSSASYNTASDYRLKENVVPLAGAADRLAQIPVHRFNFIADPNRTVDGFLAHEVQAFVPECVTGEKDQVETVDVTDEDGNVTTKTRPVYQGIDQSKLVPLLTAALQEALQKIDALEARIVSLEGGAA